jgi:hypothetical protein
MSQQSNVSSFLIKRLYDYGVRHIFGVPGDFVLGFYHQLIQSNKLKVINTCDEQGAAFAADAYGRIKLYGNPKKCNEKGIPFRTKIQLCNEIIGEHRPIARKTVTRLCILDVRLDIHDRSPALQRLTETLRKKVHQSTK